MTAYLQARSRTDMSSPAATLAWQAQAGEEHAKGRHSRAHEACFIANSITAEVRVAVR